LQIHRPKRHPERNYGGNHFIRFHPLPPLPFSFMVIFELRRGGPNREELDELRIDLRGP
jgi:hypothetical protein